MNGKGLGAFPASCTTAGVADLGWNLLAEDVSLPAAVLYEARVRHNLQWMQRFMEAYRVKLAPHGKTTMSPALFQRQIDGGAWGITLANAPQVQAAHNHGIRRVLMANQLVGRANMAIIARILRQDPDFTYFCIIDSPANAAHLGAYFGEQGLTLPVLIELGPAGGRTGVRDDAQFQAVADEIARWPALALAGIEVYEGVLQEEQAIRAFLRRATGAARPGRSGPPAQERPGADLRRRLGLVRRGGRGILEPGYRRAAGRGAAPRLLPVARRGRLPLGRRAHQRAQPRGPQDGSGPATRAAGLGLCNRCPSRAAPSSRWASATPLSTPACPRRPSATVPARPPRAAPAHWKLTAMMDQHAFMQISEGDDIQVGDMIAFDISHPCLTFDKWRQVLLVDEQYRVIDVAETFF